MNEMGPTEIIFELLKLHHLYYGIYLFLSYGDLFLIY